MVISADNILMSETVDFLTAFKDAIQEKGEWFNMIGLPKVLENYRLLHTCVRNLYKTLIKRSLIKSDPYKLERKISDIVVPDDSPYIESERAMVIGSRFSDYEGMLDFICTYFKFSTDNFDLIKIKKLNDLNGAFQWSNMTLNSSKTNTRGLANLINEARKNAPQMTASLINDSISKSSQAISEITVSLKDLSDYKREEYKLNVRLDIFNHPDFDAKKAASSAEGELYEIKKNFTKVMGKIPFYSELISEIIEEDHSSQRESLQQAVLKKLSVKQKVENKKQNTVNTKVLIMDALVPLAAVGPVYAEIVTKLVTNRDVLLAEKNTLFEKFKRAIRRSFNIPEPPLMYNVIIVDEKKGTKIQKAIDINIFLTNIDRKAKFMTVLGNKASAEIKKILSSEEDAIFQFVSKQITDAQESFVLLTAVDEYFKQHVLSSDKSKIKGLKIDLVSLKNAVVKANQKRAEYCSYIEEVEQMKKLGIKYGD